MTGRRPSPFSLTAPGPTLLALLVALLPVLPAGGALVAAPVRAPDDDGSGLWGVGVGAWPREARRRGFRFPPDLREVRRLGANHVLLPAALEQETIYAARVEVGGETIADDDLADLIREAHRSGLRTTLMPLIEVREGSRHHWRGVLAPADEAEWWASYEARIVHYARLAAREGVALLVIGSELSSLSHPRHGPRWRAVAAAARAVYDGHLAYVTNHDALDRRAPFAHVDVAGVSAYFPLAADPDAPPRALARGFRSATDALRRFHAAVRRPLVLFEVGYPSVDGGAVAPWDYTTGAPVDLEEQRAAYAAVAAGLAEAPFIEGALFWGWFGPGGPHDRYYTPRGKPAEAELERLLRTRRGLEIARVSEPAPRLTAPPSGL